MTLSRVIVSVAEQHAYHAVRPYKMMPSMAELWKGQHQFTVEMAQSICTSFYHNQHQIQMLSQKFLLRGLISHHLSLHPSLCVCLFIFLVFSDYLYLDLSDYIPIVGKIVCRHSDTRVRELSCRSHRFTDSYDFSTLLPGDDRGRMTKHDFTQVPK